MDKRKENGGHSTRSNNPNDKRRNPARKMLEKYLKEEFSQDKLTTLLNKLYKDGLEKDTKAATLFLSYVMGKPKESIDITSNDETLGAQFNLSQLNETELNALLKLHGRSDTSSKS